MEWEESVANSTEKNMQSFLHQCSWFIWVVISYSHLLYCSSFTVVTRPVLVRPPFSSSYQPSHHPSSSGLPHPPPAVPCRSLLPLTACCRVRLPARLISISSRPIFPSLSSPMKSGKHTGAVGSLLFNPSSRDSDSFSSAARRLAMLRWSSLYSSQLSSTKQHRRTREGVDKLESVAEWAWVLPSWKRSAWACSDLGALRWSPAS